MERNFETVMVEQCAPVLAGLKPAGLFRYETGDCADLARRMKNWNAQLNPKGLQVRILKGCVRTHRYLVYVYRESKLCAVLADEKVQSFLRQEGYRLPCRDRGAGCARPADPAVPAAVLLGRISARDRRFSGLPPERRGGLY